VGKDKDIITTSGGADKTKDSVSTTTTADKNKEKETTSVTSLSSVVIAVEGEKKESVEPTFEMLSNPARVMRAQVSFCYVLLLLLSSS